MASRFHRQLLNEWPYWMCGRDPFHFDNSIAYSILFPHTTTEVNGYANKISRRSFWRRLIKTIPNTKRIFVYCLFIPSPCTTTAHKLRDPLMRPSSLPQMLSLSNVRPARQCHDIHPKKSRKRTTAHSNGYSARNAINPTPVFFIPSSRKHRRQLKFRQVHELRHYSVSHNGIFYLDTMNFE